MKSGKETRNLFMTVDGRAKIKPHLYTLLYYPLSNWYFSFDSAIVFGHSQHWTLSLSAVKIVDFNLIKIIIFFFFSTLFAFDATRN